MLNEKYAIVFAVDNQYAFPAYIAMLSMISTAHESTRYHFYILMEKDFSDRNQQNMKKMIRENPQHELTLIQMGQEYDNKKLFIAHTSAATYFRLKIPTLLKTEEKCLYLDADIKVCGDLSELCDINIDSYYIAGVKAPGYYYPPENKERKQSELQLPDVDHYVNTGVLLMNIKKMRKDNMEEKFNALFEREFYSQDQDILNYACYPDIKILPPKYNLLTKYPVLNPEDYKKNGYLQACFRFEEWKEAVEAPLIIHYADVKKPWNHPDVNLAMEWWNIIRGKQSK